MPPANSPRQSPIRLAEDPTTPQTPSRVERAVDTATTELVAAGESITRLLTPLSYLSSPVEDLAATLHTDAAGLRRDGQEEDHSRESRRASSYEASPSWQDRQHSRNESADNAPMGIDTLDDSARHRQLQRVLERLYRMADVPSASTTDTSSALAYSNRTPSPTRQSIYDWAPSQAIRNAEDSAAGTGRLTDPANQQLQQHEAYHLLQQRLRDRGASTSGMGTTNGVDRRERVRELRLDSLEHSLRSRTLLQRHREQTYSLASRRVERGLAAPAMAERRERSGVSEEEDRARAQGWTRPSRSDTPSASSQPRQIAQYLQAQAQRQAEQQAQRQMEAQAQRQIEQLGQQDPTALPHTGPDWPLPNSITADDRARSARAYAESIIQRRMIAQSASRQLRNTMVTSMVSSGASTPTATPPSQLLENAIRYLHELKSCTTANEAHLAAIDHGLATKEFWADKSDDFIMDLSEIEPFEACSWLQPGTVFDGHQHASRTISVPRVAAGSSSGLGNASSYSIEQINPNARPSSLNIASAFESPSTSTRVQDSASRSWLTQQFPALGGFTPPLSTKTTSLPNDQWPVRVIVHAFDPEKMLLQGTMEAYDVPQNNGPTTITSLASTGFSSTHPCDTLASSTEDCRPKAGKKSAPIRTYLEGHIIDLRTHSFLTPSSAAKDSKTSAPSSSFSSLRRATAPASTHASTHTTPPFTVPSRDIVFPAASAQIDADNWRKLPPFCSLSSSSPSSPTISPSKLSSPSASADGDIARHLLSKAQMRELLQDYIFMRWKERCFVHGPDELPCPDAARMTTDQDRGHGLTISGFYYVSLRRSDGAVHGLYYDPSSSPYQHLQLVGNARSGWPAVEMR